MKKIKKTKQIVVRMNQSLFDKLQKHVELLEDTTASEVTRNLLINYLT